MMSPSLFPQPSTTPAEKLYSLLDALRLGARVQPTRLAAAAAALLLLQGGELLLRLVEGRHDLPGALAAWTDGWFEWMDE